MNIEIKHITSSVEHPQSNGQVEAANKVILSELKKRLDTAKGRWPEELLEVLLAYRCTPQSSIKEASYNLVYDVTPLSSVYPYRLIYLKLNKMDK